MIPAQTAERLSICHEILHGSLSAEERSAANAEIVSFTKFVPPSLSAEALLLLLQNPLRGHPQTNPHVA